MGVLSRIWESRSVASDWSTWWANMLEKGSMTTSGIGVNEVSALRSSVVWACLRALGETVGSLPFPVYRRLMPRGKERNTAHPLYRLLHDQPNPDMTSFEFRELMVRNTAFRGNGYAQIQRDMAARPITLNPLLPDRMDVRRNEARQIVYTYLREDGSLVIIPNRNLLHVRGPGSDGLKGFDVLAYARDSIGLSQVADEFQARFFQRDARPDIVLSHPGKIGEAGQKNMVESWEQRFGGVRKKQSVAVLEEGVRLYEVGFPPVQAQLAELRHLQVPDLARWFNIPLHLLAETDKAATYASVEQFQIQFVVHTVRPWLVRVEQVFNNRLFLDEGDTGHFAEFVADGLLRGDVAARTAYYKTGREGGWLSPNDIAELENRNPIPKEQGGDSYWQQGPSGQTGPLVPISPKRLAPIHDDIVRRILRREQQDVLAEAQKRGKKGGFEDFPAWLDAFFEDHQSFCERHLAPLFAVVDRRRDVKDTARRHIEISRAAVKQAITGAADPVSALERLFEGWTDRPAQEFQEFEEVENHAISE